MNRRAVIIDSHHPKHYLTLRQLGRRCLAEGIEVYWTVRRKDVLVDLVREDGFWPTVLTEPRSGVAGRLGELLEYDWKLARLVRRVRPFALIGKGITLAHVGRLTGTPSILINDDSAAANPQYRWLGYPFAHRILTAECLGERYGRRQRSYPGLMELAYLHPNAFTPDPGVRRELGVGPNERLIILRLAAYDAYHDIGKDGFGPVLARRLVRRLSQAGRVFIVSEAPLESDLASMRFKLPANRLHDALAAADLVVGDGLSVCVEAALLGTPAMTCGPWWGRHAYTRELADRFGLLYGFKPAEAGAMFTRIDTLLGTRDLAGRWAERRARMLEAWSDPTEVYWEELMRFAPADSATPAAAIKAAA